LAESCHRASGPSVSLRGCEQRTTEPTRRHATNPIPRRPPLASFHPAIARCSSTRVIGPFGCLVTAAIAHRGCTTEIASPAWTFRTTNHRGESFCNSVSGPPFAPRLHDLEGTTLVWLHHAFGPRQERRGARGREREQQVRAIARLDLRYGTSRMKKRPAPRKSAAKRKVVIPDRKLSAAILDFAAPAFAVFPGGPTFDEARGVIDFVVNVWNLNVLATPLWGKAHSLAEARSTLGLTSSTRPLFEEFSLRFQEQFADDPRVVSEWSLVPKSDGAYDLRCTSVIPQGCEAVTAAGGKAGPNR
jgi:hypothetical protein